MVKTGIAKRMKSTSKFFKRSLKKASSGKKSRRRANRAKSSAKAVNKIIARRANIKITRV